MEDNKSWHRLISLSFEFTFFHFCSVDPRDSQFLEDGTTSLSVYSADRYGSRSCCIINSNLLTSFHPGQLNGSLAFLSLIFPNKFSSCCWITVTELSSRCCLPLIVSYRYYVYYYVLMYFYIFDYIQLSHDRLMKRKDSSNSKNMDDACRIESEISLRFLPESEKATKRPKDGRTRNKQKEMPKGDGQIKRNEERIEIYSSSVSLEAARTTHAAILSSSRHLFQPPFFTSLSSGEISSIVIVVRPENGKQRNQKKEYDTRISFDFDNIARDICYKLLYY